MIENEIELQTADGLMDCFVTMPDECGPYPAVIMYMDAPGIREELRDMARRIATVGYHVVLPNLYYRAGREGDYGFDRTMIRDDAAEFQKIFGVMKSLTNAGIVSDTAPILDHLDQDAAVKPGPVGIVGYCMSGQFVVAVAAAYPERIAVTASYYGVGIMIDDADSPHLQAGKIRGELYLAFAESDHYVPDHVLEALPDVLEKAGVNYRIEIYPGTEHGFAFPERAVYGKEAAERHWFRMLQLFERNLK